MIFYNNLSIGELDRQTTRGKGSQLQAQTEKLGTVESNHRIPAKNGQNGIPDKRKTRW